MVSTRSSRTPTTPPTSTTHASQPATTPRKSDPKSDLRGRDFQAQETALAPVQMRGGERAAGDVQQAAAQGIAGGGANLPYLDRIQAAFGAHDVSDVRAHQGTAASGAAKQMGAMAYATGNNVVFGQSPDLFTTAHEAAHVVQQRKGVQLSGNVGRAGDGYEQHADQVAACVVAGESAEDLLGGASQKGAGRAQRGPVQRREDDCTTNGTNAEQLLLRMFDDRVIDSRNKATSVAKLVPSLRKHVEQSLASRRDVAAAKGRVERAIHADQDAKRSDFAGVLSFLTACISFSGAVQAGITAIVALGKAVERGKEALGAVSGAIGGVQGVMGADGGAGAADTGIATDRALQAEVAVVMNTVDQTNQMLTEVVASNAETAMTDLALDLDTIRKTIRFVDDPISRLDAIATAVVIGDQFRKAEKEAREVADLVRTASLVDPATLATGEPARKLYDHVRAKDALHPNRLELSSVEILETTVDPMTQMELRTTTQSELMLTSPNVDDVIEAGALTTLPPRSVGEVGLAIPLNPTEVALVGDALPRGTKQVRSMRRVWFGDASHDVPSAIWDNPRSRDQFLGQYAIKARSAAMEQPTMGARR